MNDQERRRIFVMAIKMTKNCPHRIRVRRLKGCSDGFEYTGEHICALRDMLPFLKGYCTDRIHKKCYLPALTREEQIGRLRAMGQKELDGFINER